MDSAVITWDGGAGFETIRALWLNAAHPHGTRMAVHTGNGVVQGQFAGLDGDGALLMADQWGQTARYTYGDVTLDTSDAGA